MSLAVQSHSLNLVEEGPSHG